LRLIVARRFFCGFPIRDAIEVTEDIEKAQPSMRFSFSRGYGWVNSQFGSQFWITVPPGKYLVTLTPEHDEQTSTIIQVDNKRAYGLRIAVGIEKTVNKCPRVRVGRLADWWFYPGIIFAESVCDFSVQRIG
jgi:hypothetical protein